MTPLEFKSWFDGFGEGIESTPTKKQWTRIKERVAEIDGQPLAEKVLDRYYPYVPIYPIPYYPSFTTPPLPYTITSTVNATLDLTFNSLAAMNILGKEEILALQ